MGSRTLLPDVDELSMESLKNESQRIVIRVRTIRGRASCPSCGTFSGRVHSYYTRNLADLPWNGVPVTVQMRSRRFFCRAGRCKQRIFTERLAHTVAPHARRTLRLNQVMDWLTKMLGGEPGARLAQHIGIFTSGDSLLRQLRSSRLPLQITPRVLGIDDWAWRKGHRYGTILCDLERRKVVDLLPNRSAESVRAWLRAHPGVEIVSRDRASAYAEAVRAILPDAVQVADRWHLLHNLTDALQRIVESKHVLLREAAKACAPQAPPVETEFVVAPSVSSRRNTHISQQRRERRLARYESVMELVREGIAIKQISRMLKIHRRTVRQWMRSQCFPERVPVHRRSSLDGFAHYLQQRYQEGCHNAAALWRELRQQGFPGGQGIVRCWIRRLRPHRNQVPRKLCHARPRLQITGSPRSTTWLLLRQPEEAQAFLKELECRSPEVAACASVAREFVRMVRDRDEAAWIPWLESANSTALASFARHLSKDQDAVLAALRLPWSNGQVEGQVHRLKLIKRQMYGRAKFDLLRLRVLSAA